MKSVEQIGSRRSKKAKKRERRAKERAPKREPRKTPAKVPDDTPLKGRSAPAAVLPGRPKRREMRDRVSASEGEIRLDEKWPKPIDNISKPAAHIW